MLIKAARVELADSALHAPSVGFGDEDFYPDVFDKAAVLTCRLAWNHPLPDGNKRAAWATLVLFLDLNDGIWDPDPTVALVATQAWQCQCSRPSRPTKTRPYDRRRLAP